MLLYWYLLSVTEAFNAHRVFIHEESAYIGQFPSNSAINRSIRVKNQMISE